MTTQLSAIYSRERNEDKDTTIIWADHKQERERREIMSAKVKGASRTMLREDEEIL